MSAKEDQMTPDTSPGEVAKSGVRRVNNMPMYLLGGALFLFLLVMMLVAADRSAQQNAPVTGPAERAGNTSVFAKEIVGDQAAGMVAPAAAAAPPEMPQMPAQLEIARPENPDSPPRPMGEGMAALGQPIDPDIDRMHMAKLQQFQEAVKAKTSVRVDAPRSSGSSATQGAPQSRDEVLARLSAVKQQVNAQTAGDPTAAYQARLAQLRSTVGGQQAGGSVGGAALLQTSATAQGKGYAQFAGSGEGDRWTLNAQPKAPSSHYELRAGFVVPATLISGINSDLPGQLMAQVAQNVYDTPTGKHLLIPQGSRLIGSYSSDVAYGQSRVLVGWQRIVFPDGKAMDIGTMPGADGAGYSGFTDQVNNHYLRIFGSAFLMSGVVAGVSMSQDRGNSSSGDKQRASDAMSEALGQVLGNTIAQMVSKNLNIAPTLEIRPGYRFNVIVTKDMTFSKPYQSFDY